MGKIRDLFKKIINRIEQIGVALTGWNFVVINNIVLHLSSKNQLHDSRTGVLHKQLSGVATTITHTTLN